MSKPRVGVTTSLGRGRALWWFMRLALWRAGIEPVRLYAGREYPIAKLDGLVVGGGDDISPTLYKGEIDPAVRIDPERDALELRVLEHAVRHDLPILGICRGSQMINTFFGGTLHEDIYEVYENAPKLRSVLPKKTVKILPGSELNEVVGKDMCRVNALHHQSVDKPGEGLLVVARDQWDMVQAIERPAGPYLIGVQWHPEFLVFHRSQQRLFRRLVKVARKRRQERLDLKPAAAEV